MSQRRVRRFGQNSSASNYEPYYRRQSPIGRSVFGRWLRITLTALVAVGLVVGAGWAFHVQNISVEGTSRPELVSQTTRETLNQHPLWTNLLTLSANSLAQAVTRAQTEQIDQVSVSKRWFNRGISVRAVDRGPSLQWQSSGQLYDVDQTGKLIRLTGRSSNLPLVIDTSNVTVSINDQVVSRQFVDFVKTVTSAMQSQLNLTAKQSRVAETTNELMIDTTAGFYIRFALSRAVDEQIKEASSILSEAKAKNTPPHEYVDVRLPYKAYYK